MMRGPEKTAMAVRNAKGEIILETSDTPKSTSKVTKIPFVRGIFNMVSSLTQGYHYLMRSADIALADAEEADREAKAAKEAKKTAAKAEAEDAPAEVVTEAVPGPTVPVKTEEQTEEKIEEKAEKAGESAPSGTEESAKTPESGEKAGKKDEKKSSAATTVVMIIGVVLGVLLAIGLFVAVPSYLFELFARLCDIPLEENNYAISLLRSVFEGVLKIVLLVVYMFAVSRMKDIRRVFMYHGAEHKTIFCYEQGLELTVENVRPQRRFHPRCGTSFIILVLLVSIVLGFFVPAFWPTWIRVIIKIVTLPLTVGIGYELIKLAGRKDNLFTRITSAPGVWLQHITTVEPDDFMIECAIAAMNEVIPEDKTKDNW